MRSYPESARPSRAATWLVTLFSPGTDGESIAGDLLEEFSQLAPEKGIHYARRWYWRQTIRTLPHLLASGFRSAPWIISAIVTGSFLLRWYVFWLSKAVVNRTIDAALSRYMRYEADPHAYVLWLTSSMLAERLAVNLVAGVLVAVAAKGREMTATMMLGLVSMVLALQATLTTAAKTGDYGMAWTLPHTFAFSVVLVTAGAAVRTFRLRSCA